MPVLPRGIPAFIRGANLAPIGQIIISFSALDVSFALVILSFISVDASHAQGNTCVHKGGKLRTDMSDNFIFPRLDVNLAHVMLRSTSVDLSVGKGIPRENLCS